MPKNKIPKKYPVRNVDASVLLSNAKKSGTRATKERKEIFIFGNANANKNAEEKHRTGVFLKKRTIILFFTKDIIRS
ncbi:MAG: hypothetical protein PHY73_01125 [Candidatus Omnitrophica bacterium]|nr:hypothetical protein [Candidatus Omnitrophota bacterium]